MNKEAISEVILIGTGNLAWHLAYAFNDAGIKILQIAGRNEKAAKEIAELYNTNFTTNIKNLYHSETAVYFIAVKDNAIGEVASIISQPGRKIVHCAGGVSINMLPDNKNNDRGVFYPMLSFNKNVSVNFSSAIICVDSNHEQFKMQLTKLANCLSRNVYQLTDEQRLSLNLAAVWVNNFSNHLYAIADELLEEQGLHFQMLIPLIENTVSKITSHRPSETQTGPAKRNDDEVLKKHLALLSSHEDYSQLYKMLSESIIKKYHHS